MSSAQPLESGFIPKLTQCHRVSSLAPHVMGTRHFKIISEKKVAPYAVQCTPGQVTAMSSSLTASQLLTIGGVTFRGWVPFTEVEHKHRASVTRRTPVGG